MCKDLSRTCVRHSEDPPENFRKSEVLFLHSFLTRESRETLRFFAVCVFFASLTGRTISHWVNVFALLIMYLLVKFRINLPSSFFFSWVISSNLSQIARKLKRDFWLAAPYKPSKSIGSKNTAHVFKLKRHGNGRFHVLSTWNTHGVFIVTATTHLIATRNFNPLSTNPTKWQFSN